MLCAWLLLLHISIKDSIGGEHVVSDRLHCSHSELVVELSKDGDDRGGLEEPDLQVPSRGHTEAGPKG